VTRDPDVPQKVGEPLRRDPGTTLPGSGPCPHAGTGGTYPALAATPEAPDRIVK
jgi:hypothetical protein